MFLNFLLPLDLEAATMNESLSGDQVLEARNQVSQDRHRNGDNSNCEIKVLNIHD